MKTWAEHLESLERRSIEEARMTFDQGATRTPATDQPRTIAHLASTTQIAIGHVDRHLDEAAKAKTPTSVAFNLEHAKTHTTEAAEHIRKLIAHLRLFYPKVAAEMDLLDKAIEPGGQVPK